MKKLLIITYYWPPASGPGVQRMLKFSKYLPAHGWHPHILTVKNGSYPATDPSLLSDIPEGVQIDKTPALEPFRLYNLLRGKPGKEVEIAMGNLKGKQSPLKRMAAHIRANWFVPDARVGWNIFAWRKAAWLIDREKIDAIITTGPPHSTHLTGRKLKRKKGVSWLADFRDPWTNIYYNAHLDRSPRTIEKDSALETSVLTEADHIICVSDGLKREFEDRATDISVIYNGFDLDDIEKHPQPNATEKFYFSFVGMFQKDQDLPALWSALSHLSTEIPSFTDNFRLKITGTINSAVRKSIQQAGLEDLLQESGFVPHDEAVRQMIHSSLLYLPVPVSTTSAYHIPGKTFEYLGSRSPILAVGPPDSDVSGILRSCNRPACIDYEDEEGIYRNLKKAYLKWVNSEGKRALHAGDEHLRFSRRELTKKLVSILEKETSPPNLNNTQSTNEG